MEIFSLSYKLDKNSSSPYEPIYLDIKFRRERVTLEKFDLIKGGKKGLPLIILTTRITTGGVINGGIFGEYCSSLGPKEF